MSKPPNSAADKDCRDKDQFPERRFYGRRKGKKLRAMRQRVVDDLLPHLQIDLTEPGDMNPALLFSDTPDDVWLEIGFGNGEHLAELARQNPQTGFIGCEPFINGVSALLAEIERDGIENIRIWPDDARLLMDCLQPHSIARCFILHPDPWPKTRHHKRRFVQKETLDQISGILRDGAELRMATDVPELAAWMLEKTWHHPHFSWLARQAADWRDRPDDWPQTRYEQKGYANERPPIYLRFTHTIA